MPNIKTDLARYQQVREISPLKFTDAKSVIAAFHEYVESPAGQFEKMASEYAAEAMETTRVDIETATSNPGTIGHYREIASQRIQDVIEGRMKLMETGKEHVERWKELVDKATTGKFRWISVSDRFTAVQYRWMAVEWQMKAIALAWDALSSNHSASPEGKLPPSEDPRLHLKDVGVWMNNSRFKRKASYEGLAIATGTGFNEEAYTRWESGEMMISEEVSAPVPSAEEAAFAGAAAVCQAIPLAVFQSFFFVPAV